MNKDVVYQIVRESTWHIIYLLVRSVNTLSFFRKTAEPIELTHTIDLYKYVRWKEREISEESYRPVATSPASSLKFTFGRLGVFLQIASHI